MILLVDNYDSFTFNLAQYLGEFDQVQVVRNDADNLYQVADEADGIVFSPGPGWPKDAGRMEEMIQDYAGKKPLLGICLGHQAIAEVFGGKLDLAHQVMHGKQSRISIAPDAQLFRGIDRETDVMRYHSIVIGQLPKHFKAVAHTLDDGEIMAIEHDSLPIFGLQYHPESIGTPEGKTMLANFMAYVKEDSNE